MKYLSEKLKSLTAGIMAVAFLMAFTMSCGSATTESDADEAEATEQAEGAAEHPGGEHPSGGEHPAADDTEPADSTATEPEQPEAEEGDSDSE